MTVIIDKLLCYARLHLDLKEEDVIYVRNRLLEQLKIDAYEPQPIDEAKLLALSVPDILMNELIEYINAQGLAQGAAAERLAGSIIGGLSPLPSVVNQRFKTLYEINPRQATDYLYNLQVKNNYIKKTFVDTNIHWIANFHDNFLEITINMSKPEKRNEDIAKLAKVTASGYPKCVLCEDNLGYFGTDNHPNRTNIRTINLLLDGDPWFFQYSPYVYYDRHCIVIDKVHQPMAVNDGNIRKLLTFVEQFPHFFIGSNSDLPIVGGSILNHEHFQGGAHIMPLLYARLDEEITLKNFINVTCHQVHWYNSAFLFTSEDKETLITTVSHFITKWRTYSDKAVDIIAQTDKPHNTATLIVRYVEKRYQVYVMLRNNRQTETYPHGIFHAHPEYHPIKSEGIGLIEAAGLFILPARLKRQLQLIETGLKDQMTPNEIIDQNPDLSIHRMMIEQLSRNIESDVKKQITQYVNDACRAILENTAVFKTDNRGMQARQRFLKEVWA